MSTRIFRAGPESGYNYLPKLYSRKPAARLYCLNHPMANAPKPVVGDASVLRPVLNGDTAATILWESAWKALIRAFFVQMFGSIVVGFISNVFSEMSPSAPPGFSHHLAAPSSPIWHGLGTFIRQNAFWMIFAVLFILITGARFARFLPKSEHRRLAAQFIRINRRISNQWFSLFVVNGFTAWISTMVIMFTQQFSWARILWSAIGNVVEPFFQTLAKFLPGAGTVGQWFSWYGDNQPKFLFWLLYSAAICDDLGLPNYKALIRWGWQRLKRYFQSRWGAGGAQQSKPLA
jgi:hypothetical protein